MKILFIGGTGKISMACTRLAVQKGDEVVLLNRGSRTQELPEGVRVITGDIADEENIQRLLQNERFDSVAQFIAFRPEDVERDIRLFSGKTGQYIFISSASAYQKPLSHYLVDESTPLYNPFWEYSRQKIACEERLMRAYRESGFPITVIRPSHTYDEHEVPVSIHGKKGSWQVLQRMLEGKPVILHGDGQSLWTFTFNEDFAAGFYGLIGNPHAIGEAVGITSDESLTWDAAYHIIARQLDVSPFICHISSDCLIRYDPSLRGPLLGDKANSIVFDNRKLKRLVPGFTAFVRFDQGVARVLRYLKDHPEYKRPDPEFDRWCEQVIASCGAAV